MRKRKIILLVEDNPSDVELARLALEKLDLPIEMTVAWDGVEAVDHLFQPAGRLPDLILLDLKLPRLDGFSVLDHIRRHERTREIPVIILTTSNDEQTIARSYDAGATGFIHKSPSFSNFRRTLAEAVRRCAGEWCQPDKRLDSSRP